MNIGEVGIEVGMDKMSNRSMGGGWCLSKELNLQSCFRRDGKGQGGTEIGRTKIFRTSV